MGNIYEWYIDVFFIVNFLMDMAGLLAAGILCNLKIRLGRLILVSAGATACSVLLLLCLPAYLWYLLMVHLIINPLMMVLSFQPRSWWDFFRPLLTVYFVLFVAGGVQQSLRLYSMDSAVQVLFGGLLAIGMFLIWQVRQRVERHVCVAELEFFGKCITLTAFCDSGNLLRDPETGREVSILMKSVLPESWLMPGMLNTEFKQELSKKELRRIPYATVGAEKAEMEIITLDKMRIYQKGRVREVEKPVFGLFDGRLMKHPDVELLLNGAYA